jgi:hypothetical protein
METKLKNFEDLLKFGEEGEKEIAISLINNKVALMPMYQFTKENAPYLIDKINRITAPDLFCIINGNCLFVEVKTKNQWVNWKGILQTGYNTRHLESYIKISNLYKINVYICFNHKEQEPTGRFYIEIQDFYRQWNGLINGKIISPPLTFYKHERMIEENDFLDNIDYYSKLTYE